jgi:predicted AAA+ superfamily ATPase
VIEKHLKRFLKVPDQSFLLFGPRGTGKSTWLKDIMPDAFYVDLLDTSLFLELSRDPHVLESLVGKCPRGTWVVLDEIQKVPALLDEVHRLMETRGWRFVLCGSSARKLRRSGTNLLAGRALTLNMESFSFSELGDLFDIDFTLEWGFLPFVQLNRENAADILNAYVNTYVKEEIREEGIVRSVPPFLRFLNIAGLVNGQAINGQNIAREAAVPRSSVDTYFSILMDTLLAHFLPAYQPHLKVRERTHPKFYWFDAGVARAAAGLLFDPVDRLWKGSSLETLIFHELRVYNEIHRKHRQIAYYRTASGTEIDFVIETRRRQTDSPACVVCMEVKMAAKWNRQWEKAMRDFHAQHGIRVERMIGIYTGTRGYHYDGVDVLPVVEFLRQLHQGNIF